MKTWIVFLMIAVMFSGCAHVRPRLAEQDSSDVRTTIRAIWEAARIFYWDKGSWPTSVEELLQTQYLAIDSTVLGQWRFSLVGGPPQEIRATSTERTNEEKEEFPPEIIYDVLKGQWRSYPVPRHVEQKLTSQQRAEIAGDARKTIEDVWLWAQEYYKDKGMWPETVAELERERYMEVDVGVGATWQFAIIGSPPQAVVAVSKESMPDGAGRAIEFDVVSGVWRGYGQP